MTTQYKIRVYYPAPNGTNDIEIIDSNGVTVDGMSEATFGIMNINSENGKIFPLKKVLQKVAVSPIEDGTSTLNFLAKYFPSIRKR